MAALRGRSLLFLCGLGEGVVAVADVVADDGEEAVFVVVLAGKDFWASVSGIVMAWSAAGEGLDGRDEVEGNGARPAMDVSGTPAFRGEDAGMSRV
jgi:hypothetical protein